MKRAYIYILTLILVFGVGCTAEHNPVDSGASNNFDSSLIHEFQENRMKYSSVETGTDSVNSFSPTTSSFDEPCDAATCIDPPEPPGGGGGGIACIPSDVYRLEASVNGTGAYTYSLNIPTWKLSPFWGGIVLEVEEELQNFEQNSTPLLNSTPHYQTFDLDYKVEVETTVRPNGELNFKLNLFDIYSRIWFQSSSPFVSNAIITIEADAFEIEGKYTLSSDQFLITDHSFNNLNADIDIGGFLPLLDDILCFLSGGNLCTIGNGGSIEEALNDEVEKAIENVNRDSPNMFVRSLVNYPETSNLLALFDSALNELLEDDVSANLELELPSCGDIVRDGLIKLDVSTN